MRVRLPEGSSSLGVGGVSLLPDADGVCLVDDCYRELVLLAGGVEVASGGGASAAPEAAHEPEPGRSRRK
jgi:hypothetical protein